MYHSTIGSHPPVLRVKPGDSITTTTIDAAGVDQTGARVASRGNPQTGPFYVEGAMPGDDLIVHFDAIRPNRSHGFSSYRIAPNVLDPEYVPMIPEGDDRSLWRVDPDAGIAALEQPEMAVGPIELELAPMLGCFGVAPARGQAISTATSERHGGNMDYRGIVPGVTVYLPIFVEGALFHLGDGHAVQADGEILGTGIEISMDVTFRLDVRKQGACRWPRGENAEEIFTLGNARPLDQALQHATTEMLRWLQGEYQLDPISAHMLLGSCVRYEVGNVFDPAYTMVCKIAKKHLPKR